MIPESKLPRLIDRFAAVEAELAPARSGALTYVKLSKEHAELAPVIADVRPIAAARELKKPRHWQTTRGGRGHARMAEEERGALKQSQGARLEMKLQWLPKDAADSSSAIVEIRAGTGGDEAALFAADLWECISAMLSFRDGKSTC